jgi:hypothetical protein
MAVIEGNRWTEKVRRSNAEMQKVDSSFFLEGQE